MDLRQGCFLAPFLLILFILDLSAAFDICAKLRLGNYLVNHLLYADDFVLFATLPAVLQQLHEYAMANNLTI